MQYSYYHVRWSAKMGWRKKTEQYEGTDVMQQTGMDSSPPPAAPPAPPPVSELMLSKATTVTGQFTSLSVGISSRASHSDSLKYCELFVTA